MNLQRCIEKTHSRHIHINTFLLCKLQVKSSLDGKFSPFGVKRAVSVVEPSKPCIESSNTMFIFQYKMAGIREAKLTDSLEHLLPASQQYNNFTLLWSVVVFWYLRSLYSTCVRQKNQKYPANLSHAAQTLISQNIRTTDVNEI